MPNENPKPYIETELKRRKINTDKASASGEFKLSSCWDPECGSKNNSFNLYTGKWQCYSHKGNDETQKGRFVKGLAIADGISLAEEWETLNNLYPNFNEPPPRGVSRDPRKKKSFSSIDLGYVNKTHECLFDPETPLSENDLTTLYQKQAVTRSTLEAAKIGYDPEQNQGVGRYTIPIRSRLNDRWVHLKYYDPKSSKYKYLFYTAYENKETKKHKLKFKTDEMFPLVLQPDEKTLIHQLSYDNIVIVEGLWTALCLIPFFNRQGFGVLAPITGANSYNWLNSAEIRSYFQLKNLYVLYDIDTTGIKAGDLVARSLKHKAETNVYKLSLFPTLDNEKYIYGYDSSIDQDTEGKITNADPVNWIKDEAAYQQIPLDGQDWSDDFLNQIWVEFQGMLGNAEEIKDEATYRDFEGDTVVEPSNLKAITDQFLDIFHTEADLFTMLYLQISTYKGVMLKQPADETAYQVYGQDGVGCLQNDINEWCDTLKVIDPKTGMKSKFTYDTRTVDKIHKAIKWKLTIQDDKDKLIKPELNPEFPVDLRNLIHGKNHYVDFTDYLVERQFKAMHRLERTPNFLTRSQLTFNPDWEIKVTGELIYKYVKDDWWPGDKDSQRFFWEWIGLAAYGRNPLHKIVYTFGVPGSGRSQLAIIFEAIVSERRFWVSNLNALSGRFETSVWESKTFICFTDARFDKFKTSNEQAVIQTLISGSGGEGRMRSEHKGVDTKNVKFFDANMALFANGIIALTDITTALQDRIRFLNMTHSYRGTFATPEHKKKIVLEMARKLVREEKSMQALMKQGFKYLPDLLDRKDFIEAKNTKTARAIFKDRSGTKLKFTEWLIFDEEDSKHHYQSIKNLYILYLYHCLENDVKKPLGKQQLVSSLVEYYAAIERDVNGYIPNFKFVPFEKRKHGHVLRNVRIKEEWHKLFENRKILQGMIDRIQAVFCKKIKVEF